MCAAHSAPQKIRRSLNIMWTRAFERLVRYEIAMELTKLSSDQLYRQSQPVICFIIQRVRSTSKKDFPRKESSTFRPLHHHHSLAKTMLRPKHPTYLSREIISVRFLFSLRNFCTGVLAHLHCLSDVLNSRSSFSEPSIYEVLCLWSLYRYTNVFKCVFFSFYEPRCPNYRRFPKKRT